MAGLFGLPLVGELGARSAWSTAAALTSALFLVSAVVWFAIDPSRSARPASPGDYAGFWLRLTAAVIDGHLWGIAFISVIALALLSILARPNEPFSPHCDAQQSALLGLGMIVLVLGQGLYFAGMESSKNQATLGKQAVGAVVADAGGNRISFGRASARHWAKILSILPLYLGFVMAAFTERQGTSRQNR